MLDLNLSPRSHVPANCAVFFRSRERHGQLSNMTHGFPLAVNAVSFQGPEGLYQALKFPHDPDFQRTIGAQRSGMDAKHTAYTHKDTVPTWDSSRTDAMAFTLAIKLLQHPDTFGAALTDTGSLAIVEHSSRDAWWGAMPAQDGTLTGRNVLGQLLSQLRDLLTRHQDPARAAGALLANINSSPSVGNPQYPEGPPPNSGNQRSTTTWQIHHAGCQRHHPLASTSGPRTHRSNALRAPPESPLNHPAGRRPPPLRGHHVTRVRPPAWPAISSREIAHFAVTRRVPFPGLKGAKRTAGNQPKKGSF